MQPIRWKLKTEIGRLSVATLLLICCAPLLGQNQTGFGEESHGIRPFPADHHVNSDSCESFDISRLDYARKILAERHADNRFSTFQNRIIETISFARIDVFDLSDPDENRVLYRLVNSLHMRTRESSLRPQLLFSEGDELDPGDIAETERNLRSRNYLADAFIMPVAACDNRVHLLVVTQDAWTTQPIISGSREGGQSESRLGLVEGNLLGTGSEVSVLLTKEQQRDSLAYKYKKDYLFDRPLALSFGFSDNSDGFGRSLQFGKPFYTDTTPLAFDASINQTRARLTTYQNERRLVSYDVEEKQTTAFLAVLQNLDVANVTRLYSGITQRYEEYSNFLGEEILRPENEGEITFPWLAWERKSTDYVILKNIDYIELLEDIRVGRSWRGSLGYSPAQGLNASAYIFGLDYQQLFITPQLAFAFDAALDGTRYHGQADADSFVAAKQFFYEARLSGQARWFLNNRERVVASAVYKKSEVSAIHKALSLGGSEFVRGYPVDYVLGNEALGASFEYRYHSDLHLFNIIRVGWLAFFDVASIRNTNFAIDQEGYDGQWLSDVGVGLRITSSKTQVSNIVHIDLAMPTGYRRNADGYQLLLSAQQQF
jgi:hypothetical protein